MHSFIQFFHSFIQSVMHHSFKVGSLGDIVACTSEWLFAHNLASELLVAFVVFCYEHLPNYGFATSSIELVLHLDAPKEPEAACRDFVGTQTLFSLEPFFDVLHAGGLAIVLVIKTVIVEHILPIVSRPLPGIVNSVGICAGGSVWQKNIHNSSFVVQGLDIL